jgi:predicted RNase H-like HicB family nuclease
MDTDSEAVVHFRGVRPRARQEAESTPAEEQEAASARLEPALPYPLTLVREDDGQWVATIDALPGCTARGPTPDEAVERAAEAMTAWLASARLEGKDVPEPKSAQSHSGRLLLRMPQTLHAELARVAEREKVSLNQFITDVLAGALGWRAAGQKPRGRAVRPRDVDDKTDQAAVDSPEEGPRFSSTVLAVNSILVALAAVVAIVVLVVVLMR